MNSLSLLIYAVGLISNLNVIATVGVIAFPVLLIVTFFAWCAFRDGAVPADYEEINDKARYWRNWFIAGLIASLLLIVVVPSRQTTIMIAASEVAEVVVQSDQAKSLANDVTGIGHDSVELLRTYIQSEQKSLMDEVKNTVKDKVTEAVTDKVKEVAK